jgi:hypothetical protein
MLMSMPMPMLMPLAVFNHAGFAESNAADSHCSSTWWQPAQGGQQQQLRLEGAAAIRCWIHQAEWSWPALRRCLGWDVLMAAWAPRHQHISGTASPSGHVVQLKPARRSTPNTSQSSAIRISCAVATQQVNITAAICLCNRALLQSNAAHTISTLHNDRLGSRLGTIGVSKPAELSLELSVRPFHQSSAQASANPDTFTLVSSATGLQGCAAARRASSPCTRNRQEL